MKDDIIYTRIQGDKKSRQHKYLWPPQEEPNDMPIWVLNPTSEHWEDE